MRILSVLLVSATLTALTGCAVVPVEDYPDSRYYHYHDYGHGTYLYGVPRTVIIDRWSYLLPSPPVYFPRPPVHRIEPPRHRPIDRPHPPRIEQDRHERERHERERHDRWRDVSIPRHPRRDHERDARPGRDADRPERRDERREHRRPEFEGR